MTKAELELQFSETFLGVYRFLFIQIVLRKSSIKSGVKQDECGDHTGQNETICILKWRRKKRAIIKVWVYAADLKLQRISNLSTQTTNMLADI